MYVVTPHANIQKYNKDISHTTPVFSPFPDSEVHKHPNKKYDFRFLRKNII